MTWIELARQRALAAGVEDQDDEALDFILWEQTCFPLGTIEQVTAQLDEVFGVAS